MDKKNKKMMPIWAFILILIIEIIFVSMLYTISHCAGWFVGIIALLLTIFHDIPRLFINQERFDNFKNKK